VIEIVGFVIPDDDADVERFEEVGWEGPIEVLEEFVPDEEDCEGDECEIDSDEDGVPDVDDNCPLEANPEQEDEDEDGEGDMCDDDIDGDDFLNEEDNCPAIPNANQSDIDEDGQGDVCDPCADDAEDTCVGPGPDPDPDPDPAIVSKIGGGGCSLVATESLRFSLIPLVLALGFFVIRRSRIK